MNNISLSFMKILNTDNLVSKKKHSLIPITHVRVKYSMIFWILEGMTLTKFSLKLPNLIIKFKILS